jgi:hypothetical protein
MKNMINDKGNSSLKNLNELPSEPNALNVMPIKVARHSSPSTCQKENPHHPNAPDKKNRMVLIRAATLFFWFFKSSHD